MNVAFHTYVMHSACDETFLKRHLKTVLLDQIYTVFVYVCIYSVYISCVSLEFFRINLFCSVLFCNSTSVNIC